MIVIEEASEAIYFYGDILEECINYIKSELYTSGKYLVLDDKGDILYDTQPGISYKI